MPVDLTLGKSVIDAYLKGVATRQARQKQIEDLEIRREGLELRDKQLKQNLSIAQERTKEVQRWHDLLEAKAKADRKVKTHEALVQTLRSIQDGDAEIIDPKQGLLTDDGEVNTANLRPTPKGTASAIKVKEAGDIELAKNPALISRAGGIAQAQLPAQTNLAFIESELEEKARKAQRDWQEIQNQKNRDAERQNTFIRANATLARANATKEEKEADFNELVENAKQDVYEGTIPTTDRIFTGNAGVKLKSKYLGEGIKILNPDQMTKLEYLKSLEGFYAKTTELNNLLKGNLLEQAANPKIKQLQEELAADLVTLGRSRGEKGVLSDKDIARLEGNLPKILPGGFTSIRDKAGREAANERRVNDIKNLFVEKFHTITGNMKEEQKDAVRKRYGITLREEKKKSRNTSVPDYLERVE